MGQTSTKQLPKIENSLKKELCDKLLGHKINISLFDHTPCWTLHSSLYTTMIAQRSYPHHLFLSTDNRHACFDLIPTKLNKDTKSIRKELGRYETLVQPTQGQEEEAKGRKKLDKREWMSSAYKLLIEAGGEYGYLPLFEPDVHFSVAKLKDGRPSHPSLWVRNGQCECTPFQCTGVWVIPDVEVKETHCNPEYIVFELELLGLCSPNGLDARILAIWALNQSVLWQQLPKEMLHYIVSFLPEHKIDANVHSCEQVQQYWQKINGGNKSIFVCLAYYGYSLVSIGSNKPEFLDYYQ